MTSKEGEGRIWGGEDYKYACFSKSGEHSEPATYCKYLRSELSLETVSFRVNEDTEWTSIQFKPPLLQTRRLTKCQPLLHSPTE